MTAKTTAATAAPAAISVDRAALTAYLQGAAIGAPVALPPGSPVPHGADYVPASYEATEAITHPRARTATCRLLWRAGWWVRTDVHTELLRQHEAAQG